MSHVDEPDPNMQVTFAMPYHLASWLLTIVMRAEADWHDSMRIAERYQNAGFSRQQLEVLAERYGHLQAMRSYVAGPMQALAERHRLHRNAADDAGEDERR